MDSYRIGLQSANTEIMQSLITYMVYCVIGDIQPQDDTSHVYYGSLSSYALFSWVGHIRALTVIDKALMVLILEFLESGPILNEVQRSCDRDAPSIYLFTYSDHTKFSPLTFVLIYNLSTVLQHLENEESCW